MTAQSSPRPLESCDTCCEIFSIIWHNAGQSRLYDVLPMQLLQFAGESCKCAPSLKLLKRCSTEMSFVMLIDSPRTESSALIWDPHPAWRIDYNLLRPPPSPEFKAERGFCLQIWSIQTGLLQQTCRGHDGEVTDLAVNLDDTTVASSCTDWTIRCWSLKVYLFSCACTPCSLVAYHSGQSHSLDCLQVPHKRRWQALCFKARQA